MGQGKRGKKKENKRKFTPESMDPWAIALCDKLAQLAAYTNKKIQIRKFSKIYKQNK